MSKAASSQPNTKIIPEEYVRAIAQPLFTAACSNKTFRNLLSIIENLSALSGIRETLISELFKASDDISGSLVNDLQRLLELIKGDNVDDGKLQKLTLELFTCSDSNQAKLLRILKTADFICSKKKISSKVNSPTGDASSRLSIGRWRNRSPSASDVSDGMEGVDQQEDTEMGDYNPWTEMVGKESIGEFWKLINACLSIIQQKQLSIASSMLPLIECLMIMCKYRLLQQKTPSDDWFFSFTDKHRKILNSLVRKNPKLLKGSFSLLVRNSKVLDFDNKRNFFNQQLHKKPPDFRSVVKYVNVRRQYIFQDSYYQLANYAGNDLKYGKLSIRFNDEEGADYGGVTREWYQELTKEMFNPNYALFTPSAEKMGVTYQPNPSSWVNPSHLLYFKFVGRIIGKAIYDGRLLDCYFTRSVYKHILGQPVDVVDLEAIDPEYYKSLVWILENDITDVLDLTFSTEMNEFGETKIVDLQPDGRNIAVTNATKGEYVKLVVENRLTTAIKEQLNAFLSGLHEIIPKELIRIFNEKELELLISGVPDIDIDDWRNNTDYRGYSSTSAQIQWFWRAVRSFDQEEKAKLLQFATGTSKVPLDGFAKLQGIGGLQKFQIHKDFGSTDRLPSAHTCFNQIDLPMYESYEQLRERLYISITEASTGFGFE